MRSCAAFLGRVVLVERSALDGPAREALDEVPLEDQEEDDDGEGEDENGRREQAVVGGEPPGQQEHADGQGPHVLAGEEHQREDEVVPRPEAVSYTHLTLPTIYSV